MRVALAIGRPSKRSSAPGTSARWIGKQVEMYQFLSRGSEGGYELLLLIICFLLCTGQAFLVANLDVTSFQNTSLFTLMVVEETPLSGYVMKRELVYCAMASLCA